MDIAPPQPSALTTRAEALQNQATLGLPQELADARLRLSNTAYAVLALHRELLESSIRVLEQTMHGSLARATRAKAELLHAKAEVLGMQARSVFLPLPYPKSRLMINLKDPHARPPTATRVRRRAQELQKLTAQHGERATGSRSPGQTGIGVV